MCGCAVIVFRGTGGLPEHAEGMSDRNDFREWADSALYDVQRALHNGDAAPRRALWTRCEPVSVLGALRSAYGQQEVDDLFTALATSFSDCTSYVVELQAFDVVGDMAYSAGLEHTSASIDGSATDIHVEGHSGVSPRGRCVEGCSSTCRHDEPMAWPVADRPGAQARHALSAAGLDGNYWPYEKRRSANRI